MSKRGRPPHPDILTPREWEVLALLRQGLSNPEIAERLGISRDGAKYHVSQILGKLGLQSRDEAARWRYEDAPPWWATAFVPFFPASRRLSSTFGSVAGSAAKVVSIAVLGAAIGGLGLLALLLFLQSDNGDDSTLVDTASSQLTYLDADGALWLVNADGTRLRFAEDDTCASSSLHWSPTGDTLACGYQGRIELYDGQGQLIGEVELTNDLEFGRIEWSPTGDTFLYTVRGEAPFYIADRTGNLLWQAGPWDQLLSGYGTAPHGLALWSNDGARFAYRTLDGEMRVLSLATGDEQVIFGDFRPMGWAENGSSLIVATNYQPPTSLGGFPSYSVGLLDLEAVAFASIRELDNGSQFWLSPDGETAAFLTRGVPDAHGPGIAIVDLRTGEVTDIPDSIVSNPSDSLSPNQIQFSRSGEQIYWVDTGAPAIVFKANVDGTGLTKLAEVPTLGASLSPDLTQLAYHISDDDLDSVTLYLRDIIEQHDQQIDVQSFAGQSSKFPFVFAWRPVPR